MDSSNSLDLDVLCWLKEFNDDNMLKFEDDRYIDKQGQPITADDLMLVRNLIEPFSQIARDVCRICHYFKLNHTIVCYSLELADLVHQKLLQLALEEDLLWGKERIIEEIPITESVGLKLLEIIHQECCFDYLYWILWNKQIDSGIRKQYVHNYARTICLMICVFISTKLYTNKSCMGIHSVTRFLHSIHIPPDLCKPEILLSMEKKILRLVDFDLNLKPLNVFIETLMSMIINYLLEYEFINMEKIHQLLGISSLLTQNFYILRFQILVDLYEQITKTMFDLESLDNIMNLEGLHRNKMLIASGIVAAVVHMDGFQRSNNGVVHFLSESTTIPHRYIEDCRDVLIKFTMD